MHNIIKYSTTLLSYPIEQRVICTIEHMIWSLPYYRIMCDTIASISAIIITVDSMDILSPFTIIPLCICADRRFPRFLKNYNSNCRRPRKRNIEKLDDNDFPLFSQLEQLQSFGEKRSANASSHSSAHSNEFEVPGKIFPMGTMI